MNQLLLILILVAAGLAQIPNLIASRYMPESPTIYQFLKATLLISPVAILACAAFMLYFQAGSGIKSYAALSVLSVGVSILFSVFIQFFFWPDVRLSSNEVVGSITIVLGVVLVLLKDQLTLPSL
jgi:drug/metabolite transporter (DMT)-like permease